MRGECSEAAAPALAVGNVGKQQDDATDGPAEAGDDGGDRRGWPRGPRPP